ncbi:MAG: DUF512 domain-containing protein [Bacillota bacterium]
MLEITSINTRLGRKYFKVGDTIQNFGGENCEDMLDYFFFDSEERFSCDIIRKGKNKTFKIKKDADDSLGLEFSPACQLLEKQCKNKCMFCFVDQLPKGMRDTLYGKDDDYRFSFMMGNYVTMTNLKDCDIDRIVKRRFSPLYVSVHATDGELRKKVTANPNAPFLLDNLKKLTQNGIVVHTQIVLMENINDGENLKRTLEDLYSLGENCASVAIVPVGLTVHRERLAKLAPLSKTCVEETFKIVEKFEKRAREERGSQFVFCSDEMYLQGGMELPPYEFYEDFSQIENGVGLVRKFQAEFFEEMEYSKDHKFSSVKTLFATGVSFAPLLEDMLSKCEGLNYEIIAVKNDFFGHTITVSGLLVGNDIYNQVKDKDFERLFVPKQTLKEFEDIFLDNLPLEKLSAMLGREVVVGSMVGNDLFLQL